MRKRCARCWDAWCCDDDNIMLLLVTDEEKGVTVSAKSDCTAAPGMILTPFHAHDELTASPLEFA